MKHIVSVLIHVYQRVISGMKPYPTCRFHPTCSHYARESIAKHGVIRGGFLAIRRLLRCHPWGEYGIDPVPDKKSL